MRYVLGGASLGVAVLAAACHGRTEASCSPPGVGTAAEATVVVPDVRGTDVTQGYGLLRENDLCVAIPQPFSAESLHVPLVARQRPLPGTRVARGTTVTLTLESGSLGSPAWEPTEATVPDFVGESVSDAVHWANEAGLFWEVNGLGRLRASRSESLLDAYRVERQRPAPGSKLRPGIVDDGFLLTPLVIDAELAPAG